MKNLSLLIQELGERIEVMDENLQATKELKRELETLLRFKEEYGETEVVNDEPQPTLEQVRSVLAKLAQDGHQAEVRDLIAKYGASRLSDVEPQHFKALLKDAEVM